MRLSAAMIENIRLRISLSLRMRSERLVRPLSGMG